MKLSIPKAKIKNLALLFSIGALLAVAIFQVFSKDDTQQQTFNDKNQTETELCMLLNEIQGVGEVNVMIYEGETGVESVVVVCEGANDLLVNMHVREAVAAALGADEKSVKIYLKK